MFNINNLNNIAFHKNVLLNINNLVFHKNFLLNINNIAFHKNVSVKHKQYSIS